jgi:hypothetical protein
VADTLPSKPMRYLHYRSKGGVAGRLARAFGEGEAPESSLSGACGLGADPTGAVEVANAERCIRRCEGASEYGR